MGAPYSAELAEGTIGARRLILNVNATDADSGSNAVVMYSIAGGGSVGNFEIDAVTVSFINYLFCIPIVKKLQLETLVNLYCVFNGY